jgi:hypothetical protein
MKNHRKGKKVRSIEKSNGKNLDHAIRDNLIHYDE